MNNKLYETLDLGAKGVWFTIVCGIILLLFVIFMPKRLKKREIYFTFGVVSSVATILDNFFITKVLDLFDIGTKLVVGIGDIISYSIIPPCLAVIFLNFYTKEKKWLYVAIFSIVSYLYEITLVNLGYLTLKGWNSLYSIPVHILSYGVWFPWHLKLMREK